MHGQQGWPPPRVPSLLPELGQDGGGEENTIYPWISAKQSLKILLLYMGIGINLIFMMYFIS